MAASPNGPPAAPGTVASSTGRRSGRELLGVFASFLALAVAWTWPLARHWREAVPHDPRFGPADGSDIHTWLWDLWWARKVVEEGYEPFFCPIIFHPHGHGLALHTHVFAWGLFSVPLQHLGGLSFAYCAMLLLLLAFAGTATWVLARALGAGIGGAAFAGFAWAFSPYFLQKGLVHMNLFASPWPPLAALFLLRWMDAVGPEARGVRTRNAVGLGAVVGLCLLTSSLASVYTFVLCAFVLLIAPPTRPDRTSSRRSGLLAPIPLLLSATLAVLLAAPLLRELAREWSTMGAAAARAQLYHPRLVDFFRPPGLHPLIGGLGAAEPALGAAWEGPRPESSGLYLRFSLLLAAALGLLGTASSERQRALRFGRRWAAVAACLLFLAWDPGGDPEGWAASVYREIPPFELLRQPARFTPYALLPLCMLAAAGVDRLARGGRGRKLLLLGLVAVLGFESWVAPYPRTPIEIPHAVRAIAARPGTGAVCRIPFFPGSHVSQTWQTVHERPVLSSYVARPDPERVLRAEAETPALYDLCLGRRLPSAEELARDLEVAEVEHVLVPTADLLEPRILFDLLDAMEGWRRQKVPDDVAWWSRDRDGRGR